MDVPICINAADAGEAGRFAEIRFYRIFDQPAPLAGSELPREFTRWDELYSLGFQHVVCLCSERPTYDPTPLELSIAVELDDLAERRRPCHPAQERKRILEIAAFVFSCLAKGEGVLVHCAAGRGRTGTVLGAVMRLCGMPAKAAIEHLDAIHLYRSGREWPEAKWQSDLIEDFIFTK